MPQHPMSELILNDDAIHSVRLNACPEMWCVHLGSFERRPLINVYHQRDGVVY